jgi:hypothetical protein
VNGIDSQNVFEIDIKAEWKEETKITFDQEGYVHIGFDA